jgi:hypothetical protein
MLMVLKIMRFFNIIFGDFIMNNGQKLAAAVLAGLLGAAFTTPTFAAEGMSPETVLKAEKEKHACKGHNSCAGQGGDGKNACKGKGSCATDGSKK